MRYIEFKIAVGRILFCFGLPFLYGCATVPDHAEKAVVVPAEQGAPNRAEIHQRIVQSALALMASSNDPSAIALSAKSVRLSDQEDGKVRTDADQDKRQEAALQKAWQLAEDTTSPEQRELARSFVQFVMASHCAGLINAPMCLERNRVIDFANNFPRNAIGWLIFAGSEFLQGRNIETQVLLSRASNEPDLDWYFSRAVGMGLHYARLAAKSAGGLDRFADEEVAALMIAGELTMPQFSRFSQMCNPDPEGTLSTGRYEICRKMAEKMIAIGKTNIEMMVGLRAMERMAQGEKKDDEAKMYGERLAKFQSGITTLWKTKLSYPPTKTTDAAEFTGFVNDLIRVGERQATENLMRKFAIDEAHAETK